MEEMPQETIELSELENPNKLQPDWDNEPTIAQLKQNLDDAESDQDTHKANVQRWLTARTNEKKKNKNRSNVTPKLIRKQNEWRYSSLSDPFLSSPDVFNIRPVTAGDRNRAKQNELVLNNQFNTQLDKVEFIDSLVREDVDVGTVIIKVGWESYEEEVTETIPTYEYIFDATGQLSAQYDELLAIRKQDVEGYAEYSTPGLDEALRMYETTGHAFSAHQVSEEEVTTVKETTNQPTLDIPDSRNIIIDPSCNGNYKKASFIGEKFKSSKAGLERDGKYSNLDQIQADDSSPLMSPDYEENKDINSFSFKDKPRKQFVVFNYWGTWDIYGDGVLHPIVASWVGNVMIRMEMNPFPDKLPPFVKITYMPVRNSVFGEPDAELLEDNQEIIGAVTRGMIDVLGKSANGQTGMKKGLLDVTNKRRFRAGNDYEFNAIADPRQGIYTHTYPEIPSSAYNMITMNNAEAESLTGVKAFSSGITGDALSGTATGVRGVLDAASKREVGILRRLAVGMVDIGRKIISMNAVFLSEEETVRITDDRFIQVRRDDLKGNFDLQLTISTAEEDNKKAEELAFMFQTAGPNMDFGFSQMILSDIARLRKMPDLAAKIEAYAPEPDPMQVMKAELEITLLQAQIAKEQALAAKHSTEAGANQSRAVKDETQAGLNEAKAGTEVAKAKSLGSDSTAKDIQSLDHLSGKTHRQELDKDNNRAKNDAILKVVDKQITPQPQQ